MLTGPPPKFHGTRDNLMGGWRDGQMALRWCAAGMIEAAKQFRRVNGTCT